MKKALSLTIVLTATLSIWAFAQLDESLLYPPIEPLKSGYLQVSDLHSIYWEVSGNPQGIPVFGLHGGPGGSAEPAMRRFFDPQRYYIVLFDQRGAGRSKPTAEWRENSTQLLIEDIDSLREHLGITGKAVLFGGSWGSTLAVAYAEAHPDKVAGLVLRGVFLASKAEIDYFYHGGAAVFFPDNWEKLRGILPDPQSLDYPRQLFEMTQSSDPATREKAIKGWAFYEIRMVMPGITDETSRQIVNSGDMTPFSVLENYYMKEGCFIDDDQLLRDAARIADIPTYIVNGRYDSICPPRTAFALAQRLHNVKLEILERSGHSYYDPPLTEALVRATRWVLEELEPAAGGK